MKDINYIDNFAAEYFSEGISEKRKSEMEEEIKNDSKMQQHIDEYSKLWDKSSHLKELHKIDADADWKSVKKRMGFESKSKRIPISKYLLRISAIIVLAFGLTFFLSQLLKQVPDSSSTDYFQVLAEMEAKDVILPDGSVVTLNKESSLFYNNNFGTVNRDVILEGEAFFEVTKNKDLPFKVFVSNSTVEVLGTSFNVKTENDVVQLGVVTGHVAFFETTNKQNRIELVKDEAVVFNNDKQGFDDKSILNKNMIAWKTGKIEFNNVPMQEVFATVASYFGKQLVLNVDMDINESFTASFDNQSLDEVLEIINIGTKQEFVIMLTDNQMLVNK